MNDRSGLNVAPNRARLDALEQVLKSVDSDRLEHARLSTSEFQVPKWFSGLVGVIVFALSFWLLEWGSSAGYDILAADFGWSKDESEAESWIMMVPALALSVLSGALAADLFAERGRLEEFGIRLFGCQSAEADRLEKRRKAHQRIIQVIEEIECRQDQIGFMTSFKDLCGGGLMGLRYERYERELAEGRIDGRWRVEVWSYCCLLDDVQKRLISALADDASGKDLEVCRLGVPAA